MNTHTGQSELSSLSAQTKLMPKGCKAKIQRVIKKINDLTDIINCTEVRLMEVCGSHTMAIARYAIKSLLPKKIKLLSGPGCPVCVTSVGELEKAFQVARHPKTQLFTFGDMMKVPGKHSTLSDFDNIKVVYSPFDAVEYAKENPSQEVVFLGIGFETTTPVIGASILHAQQLELTNYSVLAHHKMVPPALDALLIDNTAKIDGFICPGHVSTIIGAKAYQGILDKYNIPCVITGFEPIDIIEGIYLLLKQINNNKPRVEIQYTRAVNNKGNQKAQTLIAEIFETCNANWRGIGMIPNSGLKIKKTFAKFDAEARFKLIEEDFKEPKGCLCGKILQGLNQPSDCTLFAKTCHPNNPVGPCMVSSEGACSADYRYSR